MVADTVDLDAFRGMSAQKSTDIRRLLHAVQADQAALRKRQQEFETVLLAGAAATWPEIIAKVGYLIDLFAATAEARDPRRQKLIANVRSDLARLAEFNDRSIVKPDNPKEAKMAKGQQRSNREIKKPKADKNKKKPAATASLFAPQPTKKKK